MPFGKLLWHTTVLSLELNNYLTTTTCCNKSHRTDIQTDSHTSYRDGSQ